MCLTRDLPGRQGLTEQIPCPTLNLYKLDSKLVEPAVACVLEWHSKPGNVDGFNLGNNNFTSHACNVCFTAWATRLPLPASKQWTTQHLELVHSNVLSINITFINNFSHMLWVERLTRNADIFQAFVRFKAAVKNKSGENAQRFRSDNGGKFTSTAFFNFLAKHSITC
ncbi:hypothetical protein JCM11251_003666 [Rhodosporidiobolus azoricus]